jgi:hypothetical protein
MRVKLWTSVEGGAIKANVEINNFSSSEKVQATKYGPINVNFGGAFAADAGGGAPACNFSLEPINLVIDPANSTEVTYMRVFKVTAETPDPALAAKTFCDVNLVKLTEAVSQWKGLSDLYTTNYDTVL